MKTFLFCPAVLVALSTAAPAFFAFDPVGATTDVSPVPLPAVEVVAGPLANVMEADLFGATAMTISGEQLREMDAFDFASALRRTPGVTITRYNQVGAFGGDAGGAVFLRGLGVSRPGGEIKTLVDGVPKLNGIFNHPLLDLMSIDSAARIGVHARATPLEYGNTFGAVEITTPRVEAPGEIAHASLAAGSFGTVVERFDYGAREGAVDYYLSQSLRQSNGQRPDSNGRLENYLLRFGYALTPEWELSYVLNHTHNRATDPGIEGTPLGPPSTRGERYQTDDWLHIVTLAHHGGGITGTLRAYLNDGEGNWYRRQFSGNADSLNDWRLYGVRWRETLQLWEGGAIVAGADLDYDRGTSRSVPPAPAAESVFGPATLRIFSPYVGVSQALPLAGGGTLTPSMGARSNQHNVFGSRWVPQAGLTLTDGSTQWHAGYSRALNYPGLEVEVFSQMFIPALGQSWRALRPEQADQIEFGFRHALNARTTVAITVFRNNVRDRYVIVFPPPPPPRYLNLDSYHTEGIELTAATSLHQDLATFAGVSLLRTTPGGLPYAPKGTITGGLNWRITPGWLLSTDGVYVSSMHEASEARVAGVANPTVVGAHFLLNARLARRVFWRGQRIHGEVYVAGENVTDRKFGYQPGYPIPGINFLLGLRLER